MIKKILKDKTDAYFETGSGHQSYFAPVSQRKPFSPNTQLVKISDIVHKVDEIIDFLNARGEHEKS